MYSRLNIVVVEDNQDFRELIALSLRQSGYFVCEADCAEVFDDLSAEHRFNLLILDLNLPSEDGLSIARRTKRANPNLFIIMLTARHEEDERIAGYDSGADVYLAKPVSKNELLAVVKSIERRINDRVLSRGVLVLDVNQMTLTGKRKMVLNKDELMILKSLIESETQRLPYYRLIEINGKEADENEKKNLEVRIVRLRKKLVDLGSTPEALKAIRGEGYQLTIPIKII